MPNDANKDRLSGGDRIIRDGEILLDKFDHHTTLVLEGIMVEHPQAIIMPS